MVGNSVHRAGILVHPQPVNLSKNMKHNFMNALRCYVPSIHVVSIIPSLMHATCHNDKHQNFFVLPNDNNELAWSQCLAWFGMGMNDHSNCVIFTTLCVYIYHSVHVFTLPNFPRIPMW